MRTFPVAIKALLAIAASAFVPMTLAAGTYTVTGPGIYYFTLYGGGGGGGGAYYGLFTGSGGGGGGGGGKISGSVALGDGESFSYTLGAGGQGGGGVGTVYGNNGPENGDSQGADGHDSSITLPGQATQTAQGGRGGAPAVYNGGGNGGNGGSPGGTGGGQGQVLKDSAHGGHDGTAAGGTGGSPNGGPGGGANVTTAANSSSGSAGGTGGTDGEIDTETISGSLTVAGLDIANPARTLTGTPYTVTAQQVVSGSGTSPGQCLEVGVLPPHPWSRKSWPSGDFTGTYAATETSANVSTTLPGTWSDEWQIRSLKPVEGKVLETKYIYIYSLGTLSVTSPIGNNTVLTSIPSGYLNAKAGDLYPDAVGIIAVEMQPASATNGVWIPIYSHIKYFGSLANLIPETNDIIPAPGLKLSDLVIPDSNYKVRTFVGIPFKRTSVPVTVGQTIVKPSIVKDAMPTNAGFVAAPFTPTTWIEFTSSDESFSIAPSSITVGAKSSTPPGGSGGSPSGNEGGTITTDH